MCSRTTLMRPGGDEKGAGQEGKGEGGVGGTIPRQDAADLATLNRIDLLGCHMAAVTASPLVSCLLSSLPALLLSGFLSPTDLSLSKLHPLETRACIFSPLDVISYVRLGEFY